MQPATCLLVKTLHGAKLRPYWKTNSQSSFFIPQESFSGYVIAAGTEIKARQPSSRELVLTLYWCLGYHGNPTRWEKGHISGESKSRCCIRNVDKIILPVFFSYLHKSLTLQISTTIGSAPSLVLLILGNNSRCINDSSCTLLVIC